MKIVTNISPVHKPINDELINYLTGKKIILVGNASSLQDSDHSEFIDSFDVVIRFNLGVPTEKTGKRTDVWVCATSPEEAESVKSIFDPKYIIRFPLSRTTRRWDKDLLYKTCLFDISNDHKEKMKRQQRNDLGVTIDSSTGAKTIDLLTHQLGLDISIIGFDFFRSGTFYRPNGKLMADCHEPYNEKEYVESNPRVKIYGLPEYQYIVISGYTINTPYEESIKDLEYGLKKYNIPYKFYGYKSRGEWVNNTMVKAELFQQAMNEFPGKDILWIDADAVVNGPLIFFDRMPVETDISFHYYQEKELLSGTLYIANNDIGRKLVDRWVEATKSEVAWDQKILQRLVECDFAGQLAITPLPEEYVKIKKRNEDIANTGGIISHKQLSRLYRERGASENRDIRIRKTRNLHGRGVKSDIIRNKKKRRMKYVVVSGYTIGTQYEKEIEDLRTGLEKFEIPYKFYGYESEGEWTRNTMAKPKLLERAMNEFPNKDVVWIDADAVIKKNPVLFSELTSEDYDICCHFYRGRELLTGTLYIKNSVRGKQLVRDWASNTDVDWDQRILQRILRTKYHNRIRIKQLPEEYVKIKKVGESIENVNCVIGHKQLSREQRHVIGMDPAFNKPFRGE